MALLCVALCALVFGAASAAAIPTQFGESGSGPGQFSAPQGVAVDQSSGDVYVADRNNSRVEKFTNEGAFLLEFLGAGGGFSEPEGIAVDNSLSSLSKGDVYVADNRNGRVQKFSPNGEFLLMFGGEVNENGSNVCLVGEKCRGAREGTGNGEFRFKNPSQGGVANAVAVDSLGNVFVGDQTRVQEFSSSGVYESTFIKGPEPFEEYCGEGFNGANIAIDTAGDLYVQPQSTGNSSVGCTPVGIQEYNPSGTLVRTLDAGESLGNAVAVDSSNDVFFTAHGRVIEFSSAGSELAVFGSEQADDNGLAVGGAIKRLYGTYQANSENFVRLITVPPPGPLVLGESVNGIEPASAMVGATVNPEGHATTYRLEYGTTSSYGSSVPSPEGTLGASFNDEPVTVPVDKLRAATVYHYRFVATDSEGHVTTGPDQTFETLPALSIDIESPSDVTSTSATLEAEVNPLGALAMYRIEYDTSEYAPGGPSHGKVAAEGSLAAVKGDVTVTAHVQGLVPHTVYHYRVVASDEREGVAYTVDGPDRALVTQTVGGPLTLPDGRAWELISPANKHGALIFALNQGQGEIRSSPQGDAITYTTNTPIEYEVQGHTFTRKQVLSLRGAQGWSSCDLGTQKAEPEGLAHDNPQYPLFSTDLQTAVEQQEALDSALLSEEASERTPYVARFTGCASKPSFTPLVTALEPYADVPTGTHFGGYGTSNESGVRFLGASADLHHVIVRSDVQLTETPTSGKFELYEWSAAAPAAQRLQLVSLLPSGEVAPEFSDVGSDPVLNVASYSNGRNAVSDDGTRIFMSVNNSGDYMRDTVTHETIRMPGTFQWATPEITGPNRVSKAFFSSGGGPLVECEIAEEAGKDKCNLTDLTPNNGTEQTEMMWMLTGVSEDGSYVYFVANGALAPGAKHGGCDPLEESVRGATCNLYVYHNGVTHFIAQLSDEDFSDWSPDGTVRHYPLSNLTASVSRDGRYLAFMSNRSLTGYDNRDAVSGQPDEEVYLYDASREHVVCVSCNPTGARPLGVALNGLQLAFSSITTTVGLRFAANIPGWTRVGENEAFHQSRYLSDSGRLFFNSSDALVPQDVNGTQDTYEYEPVGIGSCTTASLTFSEASGGCTNLISSGSSPNESVFMEASEGGNDVFFLTGERLVPEDTDTALDVYDAHVCTGAAPCPSPALSTPECTNADSCRAAPALQPSIFGAPPSATFSGTGDVIPTPTGGVSVKILTRAQKLVRALRLCQKKKNKRKRACEREAHRHFDRDSKSGRRANATKRSRG